MQQKGSYKPRNLYSASYVSWQHDTARNCCRAPAVQQSIDISCRRAHSSKPAASARRMMGQTDRQTDRQTLDSFVDAAGHTMRAVLTVRQRDCCSRLHCCRQKMSQQGTKVCRYNWHSVGSLGWPFPMLKYWYISRIKYTEAVLSNSTHKPLWFEITEMLTAV